MKQNNTSIQVIGFDLDDTLWPIEDTIRLANKITWDFLCEKAPKLTEKSVGISNRTVTHPSKEKFKYQISQARLYIMQEQLKSVGLSADEANNIALQAMDVFLDYRHRLTFFDGVIDGLTALKKSYRLASISNGNAKVSRIHELADIFDFSINAEDINSAKPEPDLFHAALTYFNCGPEQMIYVGDSIEHDIQATNALNMPNIWLNWNQKSPSHTDAKHEAHNFSDVLRLIKQIALTQSS